MQFFHSISFRLLLLSLISLLAISGLAGLVFFQSKHSTEMLDAFLNKNVSTLAQLADFESNIKSIQVDAACLIYASDAGICSKNALDTKTLDKLLVLLKQDTSGIAQKNLLG